MTCKHEGCTNPIEWAGVGRPPKYCLEHRPNKDRDEKTRRARADRAADRARAAELGESPSKEPAREQSEYELERKSAEHQIGREGGRAAVRSIRAWQPQRLAIALGWTKDPRRAAELVGVNPDAEGFAALLEEARGHERLTAREPAAIGDVVNGVLALGAIQLAATMQALTPRDLVGGLRRLAEALTLVQGKAQVAHTELDVVFRLPGEESGAWDLNTLLPPSLRTIPPSSPGPATSKSAEPSTSKS